MKSDPFSKLIFLASLIMVPLFVFARTQAANAEPMAVIVNSENNVAGLSDAEIKSLYENDVLSWQNGKPVILYDLPVKDETRKRFSSSILGRDAHEVAREWANKKITNTAKNPPITLSSGVLVQNRVAEDPAAIGYLPKSQVKNRKVKIVNTID